MLQFLFGVVLGCMVGFLIFAVLNAAETNDYTDRIRKEETGDKNGPT